MAAGGSNKAVVAALLANGGIAIAKFAGWVVTGGTSSSMLAESIHSVADTGNQALLLFGGKAAKKDADAEHQFGYGGERYFWSFVVALVLFALGSAYAVYEGIHKIQHPEEVNNFGLLLGILAFGIVLEGSSFRTAINIAKPLKGDESWWSFVRKCRVPELAVVLLEDLGAQLGLIIAFFAVLGSRFVDPIFDGIGTLSIGILLGLIAIILIIEMRSMLIGEGATPEEMKTIRTTIASVPNVKSLIHVRTNYHGPDALLVGAKVEFADHLSVAELAATINDVEDALRSELSHADPIYIEPDIQRFASTLKDHVKPNPT